MSRLVKLAPGGRSFGWGFADQCISSATTLVLTIAGGRIAGAGGLGVIVLGWSAYLLALVFQRALVTRPLVALSTTLPDVERREAGRRGLTAACCWAACSAGAFGMLGVLVPGEIGRGLLIFSPWVAAAMLQDYWRTLLFRDGRGGAAAANDAAWLAVFALLLVPASIASSDAAVAAAWGGGALVAAALGFAQTRLAPVGLRATWRWWQSEAWGFSRWLGLEGVYYSAANATITIVVDKTLGAPAVGGLRAAQSIFAPLTLLTPAIALPGLPAVTRAVALSSRAGLALARKLSGAVMALTAVYVILMVSVGSALMPLLLGDSFEPYRDLALPIGVWQEVGAAGVGLTLLLTARRRGRELLVVRLVESTAIVALIWILSARHGLEGAAWGYAAGAALGLLALLAVTTNVQQEAVRLERRLARLPAALGVAACLLVLGLPGEAHSAAGGLPSAADAREGWTRSCGPRTRHVRVGPDLPLPAAVARRPAGTVFCIAKGVHRLRTAIVPKTGDAFLGQPGAVLSGAKEIGSRFVRSGKLWSAGGQTQQNPAVVGECAQGTSCRYADDVFLNERPLVRVLDRSSVRPGRFYFDYEHDRIWIADDPRGHRVEAAVATRAFRGWGSGADDVRIDGLVIEKFANEAQIGAVNGRATWSVVNCLVRLNHGVGIQDAHWIVRNRVDRNGQLGIGGDELRGALVAENEITRNNYAGFDLGWEAGGGKWLRTTALVVRGNLVRDNGGPGLWTDTDNVRTRYLGNTVTGNRGAGIEHETSYSAVIVRNRVRGNGFGAHGWLNGAGILVNSSAGVEIGDNEVDGNRNGIGLVASDRGSGSLGPHVLRDVDVHDNTIAMPQGRTGLVHDNDDPLLYARGGNRFRRNSYVLGCGRDPFAWAAPGSDGYSYVTRADWVAAGNDREGRFKARCKR